MDMATPPYEVDATTKNVLLLIGKSKSPILANASLLSRRCDYYKQALSHTWHQETTIPRGVKLNPQATKSIKAVLTHPNADCATVKIVLGFIEFGKITVPDDSLAQVAYFADELALPSLVQQCLAHYAKHYVQTENTLLFTMLCLDLNHPEFLEEAYKEADDIKWLMKVIQAGRSTLADADVADVERLFSLKGITSVQQKWRILIGWLKSRQGLANISVEGGAKGFDVDLARQDAIPLMHHIDWSHTEGIGAYSILRSQVLPYLAVTSPEYQAWFKLHHESVILLALVRLMGDTGTVATMKTFQSFVSIRGETAEMIGRNHENVMTAFRSHGFCFRCDAIEYLADLTDMEEIFLEETTLKTIPEPFTNLPRLSRIYIANSVPSPAHVVHSFQNVCLPESLGRLTSLTELIITNAQLHGRLLTCIGFLSNLKILNLSKNKLYGRIPKSVGSLKNLIHLNLERNELSGAIPGSITSLSNLQILNLGHNKLSGAIPSSIGNLEHLEKLNLENNNLKSLIPISIGNISSLKVLRLSSNQLFGEVPNSLMQLTSLDLIEIQNNCLTSSNFQIGDQKPPLFHWKRIFA